MLFSGLDTSYEGRAAAPTRTPTPWSHRWLPPPSVLQGQRGSGQTRSCSPSPWGPRGNAAEAPDRSACGNPPGEAAAFWNVLWSELPPILPL